MLHKLNIQLIRIPAMLGVTLLFALCAQANTLNKVSVGNEKNGAQVIRLVFDDAVTASPIHFTTSNPNRIVLDFSDTKNALGRKSEKVQGGAVRGYSVLQAADRTRVVLDLNNVAAYDVKKDKNQVLVAVRDAAGKGAQAPLPTFASRVQTSKYNIQAVDFRRGGGGEGRIEVKLSDPGVGIDVKQKGQVIQVDFLNASLPTDLQKKLDVSEFATPAQYIETTQLDKQTRMVIRPRGLWDYFAYQAGSTFIVEVRSLEGAAAKAEDKPRYSGEKLSLDFQNVEVRAVLKVIADFTGLNIVTSETVGGNLTLRLKDVPWDQALDIIMRTKGLDKRASGNVIWVAPRDELASKEKQELEAKKQIADLEVLVVEPIKLNYLRASEAVSFITGGNLSALEKSNSVACTTSGGSLTSSAASAAKAANLSSAANKDGRILSDRGSVTFDLKTNTLFVKDTHSKIEEVKQMLALVDVPARQVVIEARIVNADEKFNRNLGARLGFQGRGKVGTTLLGSGVGTGGGAFPGVGTQPTSVSTPVDFGFGGPAFGVTVYNPSVAAILSLELQALEADSRGKIISNPKVITTNQKPAVITQGVQVANLVPGTADNPARIQFDDALLCLLVDPQILNNDNIILDVVVTRDTPGASVTIGGVSGTPIDKRKVQTQVRVADGETVVLGGVFEQTTEDVTSKVPLIGDLPVLGRLFRSDEKVNNRSELLIFLTPRILRENMVGAL